MEENILKEDNALSYLLTRWYDKNKRDLPWRHTTDPYLIWISEVILQQTRVDQGLDYLNRFVKSFPDVKSLADADEDQVLKLWQGLGYYSRARNLHTAAKSIVTEFGGLFPHNYKDILSLKGVGEYTAAAIASFCYGLPYAVVDGNVFRVLSRLFTINELVDSGSGKKMFTALAQEILDANNPGIHNQAIMELGALQCTPTNPVCEVCPLAHHCMAYANHSVSNYPVKKGKTIVKNRYFNYLDIRDDGFVYIFKRTGNDIWKNLYELPLIETDTNLSFDEFLKSEDLNILLGDNTHIEIRKISESKHVLSHRIIYANFYRLKISDSNLDEKGYLRIPIDNIHNYAISRLVHKYLDEHFT